MKRPPDKPLTCVELKNLLKLSDIKFSNKLKVEGLRLLCQKHNLIEPAPSHLRGVRYAHILFFTLLSCLDKT
jgi:hypothetical protein